MDKTKEKDCRQKTRIKTGNERSDIKKEMTIMEKKNKVEHKKVYKKPVFKKEKGLVFPMEVIEKFNGKRFCVQCSSCHGCQ